MLAHRKESPAKHYHMLLIAVSVVSGLVIVILIALVVFLLVRNRRRPQNNAPGDGSKPDEDVGKACLFCIQFPRSTLTNGPRVFV